MIRSLIALLSALLLAGSLIGVATAAPKDDHHNIQHITLDCEGIGELDVLTTENGATGFASDGEVFVAKRFEFETMLTVTTFDGAVFGPTPDSFSEGAKGKGFESRLIECTFPNEFTDTFILDESAAEFFGVPVEYVGTEVTIEGSGTGTVWIIDPGK